jgi:hypothetical protein
MARAATVCMFKRVAAALALALGSVAAMAQQLPADHAEWSVETGYLTKIKHNSPLDYRVIPT